jgi:tetratricopeptide (TPR) repeat protein
VTNLALALVGVGRGEEAVAASEEVAKLFRQLAADRPDVFVPDLARSLNSLSFELSGLGRGEEALAASEEAVAIYRQLAADRQDAFTAELARSLDNLSVAGRLGRGEEALAASEEAPIRQPAPAAGTNKASPPPGARRTAKNGTGRQGCPAHQSDEQSRHPDNGTKRA